MAPAAVLSSKGSQQGSPDDARTGHRRTRPDEDEDAEHSEQAGSSKEVDEERAPPWSYDPARKQLVFRPGLMGAVFGATHATFDECLQRGLFGLPGSQKPLVTAISRQYESVDLPLPVLFLFNFQTRLLHGIFVPRSPAGFPLRPRAWVKGCWSTALQREVSGAARAGKTSFPAQIEVELVHAFEPLDEATFRPAMNYYARGKFDLSLTGEQVEQLVTLFLDRARGRAAAKAPRPPRKADDEVVSKPPSKKAKASAPPPAAKPAAKKPAVPAPAPTPAPKPAPLAAAAAAGAVASVDPAANPWSKDEEAKLAKAVAAQPNGTEKRWEMVAAVVGTRSKDQCRVKYRLERIRTAAEAGRTAANK